MSYIDFIFIVFSSYSEFMGKWVGLQLLMEIEAVGKQIQLVKIKQIINNNYTDNNNMNNQQNSNKKQRKDVNVDKTLMRLENPIYQLKKKDQSQHQYVIRKMMNRQEPKPKMQPLQKSPLLKQLAAFMPIFKKANQELNSKVIVESEKIDAKLEIVEDSSSSSSDDEQQPENTENMGEGIIITKPKKNKAQTEMVDQNQQSKDSNNTNQIELNFLRYEIPQQLQSIEVKQDKEETMQKPAKKLIEQI